MGYRSDVLVAVAFRDAAHRDEVWAVYCINPTVVENKLARRWKPFDKGKYPALWFHDEGVKWYDSYDFVQGINHMTDLVLEFYKERDIPYACIRYRIGEDLSDIETVELYPDDAPIDMYLMLWGRCGISRRLEHNFT